MIEGSERKGRITEEDLKKFINKQINDQQNYRKWQKIKKSLQLQKLENLLES